MTEKPSQLTDTADNHSDAKSSMSACSTCQGRHFYIEVTSSYRGHLREGGVLVATKHYEEHHDIHCLDCKTDYDYNDFSDLEHDW